MYVRMFSVIYYLFVILSIVVSSEKTTNVDQLFHKPYLNAVRAAKLINLVQKIEGNTESVPSESGLGKDLQKNSGERSERGTDAPEENVYESMKLLQKNYDAKKAFEEGNTNNSRLHFIRNPEVLEKYRRRVAGRDGNYFDAGGLGFRSYLDEAKRYGMMTMHNLKPSKRLNSNKRRYIDPSSIFETKRRENDDNNQSDAQRNAVYFRGIDASEPEGEVVELEDISQDKKFTSFENESKDSIQPIMEEILKKLHEENNDIIEDNTNFEYIKKEVPELRNEDIKSDVPRNRWMSAEKNINFVAAKNKKSNNFEENINKDVPEIFPKKLPLQNPWINSNTREHIDEKVAKGNKLRGIDKLKNVEESKWRKKETYDKDKLMDKWQDKSSKWMKNTGRVEKKQRDREDEDEEINYSKPEKNNKDWGQYSKKFNSEGKLKKVDNDWNKENENGNKFNRKNDNEFTTKEYIWKKKENSWNTFFSQQAPKKDENKPNNNEWNKKVVALSKIDDLKMDQKTWNKNKYDWEKKQEDWNIKYHNSREKKVDDLKAWNKKTDEWGKNDKKEVKNEINFYKEDIIREGAVTDFNKSNRERKKIKLDFAKLNNPISGSLEKFPRKKIRESSNEDIYVKKDNIYPKKEKKNANWNSYVSKVADEGWRKPKVYGSRNKKQNIKYEPAFARTPINFMGKKSIYVD